MLGTTRCAAPGLHRGACRALLRHCSGGSGGGGSGGEAARDAHEAASKDVDTASNQFTALDLAHFDPSRIRNFCIIAHIDHGKSTLADRLLELTGNLDAGAAGGNAQALDTLKVERERGITVKAQTASMLYKGHMLNLVDTPGHVDFSYEVSRSLAACEGALLLVDSTQGIQAQTMATYQAAAKHDLLILPVLTKTDLPHSDPERTALSLAETFGFELDCIRECSAKTGAGVPALLDAIVEHIPAPAAASWRGGAKAFEAAAEAAAMPERRRAAGARAWAEAAAAGQEEVGPLSGGSGAELLPLRARLVDSWYDEYRGVVCVAQVVEGTLREGEKVRLMHSGTQSATMVQTQDASEKSQGSRGGGGSSIDVEGKVGAAAAGGGGGGGGKRGALDCQEVGLLLPALHRTGVLGPGQVGYVMTGLRTTADARAGDTIHRADEAGVTALDGFSPPRRMVFASIYAADASNFDELRRAVERLVLNDASVSVARESSPTLGLGLRCGFLGLLHMEVFNARLTDEFDMPVLITAPMVPYIVRTKGGGSLGSAGADAAAAAAAAARGEVSASGGPRVVGAEEEREYVAETPSDFPDGGAGRSGKGGQAGTKPGRGGCVILEPMVEMSIITPAEHIGALLPMLADRRGEQLDMRYLDDVRVALRYSMPWAEVVVDLYDQIKSATSGYASVDYEPSAPQAADVVKVTLLLNGEPVDGLSFVCHKDKAQARGRQLALKLKTAIARQQFEVSIQAALGAKVIAKERIAPFRKNVLMRSGKTVGGGDVTRKKKLLAKQKKGKARMKTVGQVPLSQKAFWSVMSTGGESGGKKKK
jgi:small GTP-binding protein